MLKLTKAIACCLSVAAFANFAAAGEAIAYRLKTTKELHFDDVRRAEQHLAAVEKLGCEARMDAHGGHTDVAYRCSKWKVLEVADDRLAHQWEDWLKKSGFETVHGHSASHGTGHEAHNHAGHSHGAHGAEEVLYMLPDWKVVHARNTAQMAELIALMKGLGCEVQTRNHEGHTDVSVRCREWKHMEVATHKAATGWQDWLQSLGFQTRHEH